MQFDIDPSTRRQGRAPHELAMVNLLVFNLLALVALLAGSFLQQGSALAHYRLLGVLAPLGVSLGIVAYTFVRAARARARGAWFAAAHWEVAKGRCKILLITYAVGAGLIALGWLISQGQKDPRMADLMFIALQRVALAPLLISVMVLAVLESSGLVQAGNGEVPEGVVKRLPPPADSVGSKPGDPPAAG